MYQPSLPEYLFMIVLACNSKITAFWWCGRWGYTTTLYHCLIETSCGSESEGGGHVCYTIHVKWTNVCEGGQKVKASTLHGSASHSLIKRCGRYKPHKRFHHKDWSNSPGDSCCSSHIAGIGHHLPRTGGLPPIQSRCEGNGGWRIYNMVDNEGTLLKLS